MIVRLRAHHLLCMLTYVGRGYNAVFVANYTAIIERLSAGADILVIAGPDDICAPLLQDPKAHCHNTGIKARDQQAAAAVSAWLGQTIMPGTRLALTPSQLADLRQAFADGKIRAACQACQWTGLCSDIAATDFADTKLSINQ